MLSDLILLLQNLFALFVESAPWLLLGLLIAGVMNEWVPIALLQKHMGDRGTGSILKAAFIGAPLPLCSCGVIPAAVGLRRAGASKPATVSFLVSTPETGVDSISVSYALLGPVFAVVRPIAAIISAIYTAIVVKVLTRNEQGQSASSEAADSCCAPKPVTSSCCPTATETVSCCDSQTPQTTNWLAASQRMLQFSFGKLLDDILVWLFIGLTLAAAIQTWVPTDFLTQWGDGFIAMLVMALIGVPMYICATASTPVALGFLAAGLSPGAVLVFMLAGPATNISTMGMIAKEMGTRTLMGYLFGVVSASILLGYGLNALLAGTDLAISYAHLSEHQHGVDKPLYLLCAGLLGLLILRSLWLQFQTNRQSQPATHCH